MTALVSTEPPATEPPAASPPAASPQVCLNIIGPNTDSDLVAFGPVTFSWVGRPDASKYRLTIHYPNGASASFYTDTTSVTRYTESMPAGGSYTWDVTAFDSSGNQICQTGESTFSKEEYDTPVPRINPGPPPVMPPPMMPVNPPPES